ncbi:FAD-dependent oxidoreductase [Leptolyngbya cf. ectocarpi LEGE 11479]|uniref:FAD-dependent oxidoreductase n=1 Tax=Leptolyngbya cf. ectocarpi LEGE 11479 TaxID=1828722 RepID=A0A929FCW8_LEPEC|nr:FAD-dependent oxidoreductase [Leptolyngbya ectocarpi]MBE9070434.1 FAD-dependent oxidoreductase [Leptolyngbya cf. ectocarpi LEGE 11479]
MEQLTTKVLVVGGGTGGTAAAIQAAQLGVEVLLVSEWPWLGGMLTAAGVSAPDGNELAAFQTGLWGAFLRELERRQPGGLHHGWVSFFTYEPAVGAGIFADWVAALPNLTWRWGHRPRAVHRSGERITGVAFDQFSVTAQVTIDGTELGDLLALGNVPHRWGWESQEQWREPSAPQSLMAPTDALFPAMATYPVQSPTWVVVMQDYGAGETAPLVSSTGSNVSFTGAWEGYGPERFLNYGRLPGNRFMLNWPQQGNDYGVGLDRLIESAAARNDYWQEAKDHSQQFAHTIQSELGARYGLAAGMFPELEETPGGGAFALYPYYRESRRLMGLTTVSELDILPVSGGQVASLPVNSDGVVDAIAIGNYPNDHHYPGFDMPLAPKAIRWGGRWTGTPFSIPYGALIPATIDGLLACDKNISVTHIANGATRLQPVVLNIGQAAGAAAALCVQQGCQPRHLPVQRLQHTLLRAPAPAMLAPCFDLLPSDPAWLDQQQLYLSHPEMYPRSGFVYPMGYAPSSEMSAASLFKGRYQREQGDSHRLINETDVLDLVAIAPQAAHQLMQIAEHSLVEVIGIPNKGGSWILVNRVTEIGGM